MVHIGEKCTTRGSDPPIFHQKHNFEDRPLRVSRYALLLILVHKKEFCQILATARPWKEEVFSHRAVTDGKPLEFLRGRSPIHVCRANEPPQMLINLAHEPINLLRIPLRHEVNAPIRKILHISRDLISGGNPLRRVAEAHSLNHSRKEDLPLFHNSGLRSHYWEDHIYLLLQSR